MTVSTTCASYPRTHRPHRSRTAAAPLPPRYREPVPTPQEAAVARRLVVKVTCGTEAPERLSQALTVAATAVASGVGTSLWLTGDAVWLGVTGRVPDVGLEHATPLSDLVDAVLAGGQVTVCTQCAVRRGIVEGDLAPGARIAGAATFLAEALADDAQALVY